MDARAFLATRRPPTPQTLRRRLAGVALEGSPVLEAVSGAALQALDLARAAPGRVRESAFHLLAADALLTYACEAALEAEDPAAAFETLLRHAAEPR